MEQRLSKRTFQNIVKLCHDGLDSTTLRLETIRLLRGAVPIDSFWFATADPTTLLFTGSVVEEIPDDVTPAFVANEFLQNDLNKWTELARGQPAVNSLYAATRGKPDESRRYRELLAPLGFGDELRGALIDGGSCWGFICLHRQQSSRGFTSDEAGLLNQLTKHLAEGLRTGLLIESLDLATNVDEPGLILLSKDLTVIGMNAAAESWLPELADWPRERGIPQSIYAVAARLQESEEDTSEGLTLLPARARVRTHSGRWLLLHASRFANVNKSGQIAVIMEPAPSWDVAPLILQAYGLTQREGEVAQSVLRGRSTSDIALKLFISPLTVQQHLKSIFLKTGVSSRRELTAQIFTEQYLPRILAGHKASPTGWFA